MKAKKGQTVTSPNLNPAETWIVQWTGSTSIVVKSKSDSSDKQWLSHGQYQIV